MGCHRGPQNQSGEVITTKMNRVDSENSKDLMAEDIAVIISFIYSRDALPGTPVLTSMERFAPLHLRSGSV